MTFPSDDAPEHPTLRNLKLGRFTLPLEAAARTAMKPGEFAAYESGASIILQAGAADGSIYTVTLS